MWLFKWTVISSLDGLSGEHALVKEDDAVPLILKTIDLIFNLQSPLLIRLFLIWVDILHQLDPFWLDLVDAVNSPQQGLVDAMVAELPME